MIFNELIGPTYTPSAYSVECQITKNWYTEKVESGRGKSPYALLRTPGRKVFSDPGLGLATVRRMFALDGHLYAAVGDRYREVFADGTVNIFATHIGDDGLPAYIAGNPTQQFIVSAGNGYISQAGAVTQIAAAGFPTGRARGAAFLDGYFLTGLGGTQQFQISGINDGTSWDAVEKSSAESKPDFILSIGVLNQEFWPFGSSTIQVFNDTGDLDFPFEPRLDVAIESGIWAPASLTNVSGTWYLLAKNEDGQGMAFRMQGYSLARVSDHSFENAVRLMADSSDAVGWSYQENGHLFWCLRFPSAAQMWVYDVSVDQWHQRTYLNGSIEENHRGYCSAAAFGKVLVGDAVDGKIYEQSVSYLNDGDSTKLIRRVRRAPCLSNKLIGVVHSNLVIDGNMGIGDATIPSTTPDEPMYDPAMILRFSNDGGKTWGRDHWRGFGRGGQYGRRAIWRALGYATRRVYEIVVTAPADWAIAQAAINEDI